MSSAGQDVLDAQIFRFASWRQPPTPVTLRERIKRHDQKSLCLGPVDTWFRYDVLLAWIVGSSFQPPWNWQIEWWCTINFTRCMIETRLRDHEGNEQKMYFSWLLTPFKNCLAVLYLQLASIVEYIFRPPRNCRFSGHPNTSIMQACCTINNTIATSWCIWCNHERYTKT